MHSDQNYDVLNYLKASVLTPGERVQWRGRPTPKSSASVGLFTSLFGLAFLGFSVFWSAMVWQDDRNLALFGLPFLAGGVFMVSGPVRNYLRAQKTHYAVTNHRILIVTKGNSYKVNAIMPKDVTEYERTDKPNGTGSIQLRKTLHKGSDGDSYSTEFVDGLWGIEDVRGAASAITELLSPDQSR